VEAGLTTPREKSTGFAMSCRLLSKSCAPAAVSSFIAPVALAEQGR
jgi:hypothetical protein